MTEEEAREALFKLHYEYMLHKPKERLKLYDEYQQNRRAIANALAHTIMEQKNNQMKLK